MKKVLFLGFFLLISGIGCGASASTLSKGESVSEPIGDPVTEVTPEFRQYRIHTRSSRPAGLGSTAIRTTDKETMTGEKYTGLIDRLLDSSTRPAALEELITLDSAICHAIRGEIGFAETVLEFEDPFTIPTLSELVSCLDGRNKLSQFTEDTPSGNWFEVTGPDRLNVTDKLSGAMTTEFIVDLLKRKHDFLAAHGVPSDVPKAWSTIMHKIVPRYESQGLPVSSESLAAWGGLRTLLATVEATLVSLPSAARDAFWMIVHISQLCR